MKKITPKLVCQVIKKRDDEAYKSQFGKVLIVAGNKMYGGAAIMVAQGAVYSGAGLTTLASDAVNRAALHARIPECMFLDTQDLTFLSDAIPTYDTIVIGSGIGLDGRAYELMQLILTRATANQNLVIDGDGITLYAKGDLPKTKAQLIFTPHIGEWERLLQLVPDANNNLEAAHLLNGIVVLKSHRTKVYGQEETWQNIYGSPAMATGGMGDMLAGIIGGLLKQTEKPLSGLLAAVFFHSYIGDILAKKKFVVLPTEIAEQLPTYLKIFSEMEEQ
ncbi:NAD(P)H-hydrate dehydratase [Listeria sp. PSOL-1]|uniref:NAD(P)H-hydrate dehydratase n=1 Tax=Listeria sp. PSOL-1 TaxID=1844999 RepID=UPI0013D7601E|nr:NAD(P)H-hydrate dehydratase [Listeria sp. PSOL-1]